MTAFSREFSCVIDYKFKDEKLLKQALTHPSIKGRGTGVGFERLEFLGDRVLGLVVSDMLFHHFAGEEEGELARRLSGLVCREMLIEVAHDLQLERHMVRLESKGMTEGKRLETVLADGCEALIGAIYLDGGLEAARSFIESHWRDRLQAVKEPPKDPKNALQEWVQGQGLPHPTYHVLTSEGPSHAPQFVIEVRIQDMPQMTAQGVGTSKKEAEREAAENLILKIKNGEV